MKPRRWFFLLFRGGAAFATFERVFGDVIRLAASIQQGTVTASLIFRKLGSYPRQNSLALALRKVGRIERTGGSIGTSIVTTIHCPGAQYHQQILVGHITPDSPAFRSALHALSSKIAHSGLRAADAHNQAITSSTG